MNKRQLNVLLADDDMDDRNFFKKALEELALATRLSTVENGIQLMRHLHANTEDLPHVLFLDINMPQKNGLECLSEIRKNKKLALLPVVMFSTSNAWNTINALFKSGADIYIHKPNDFSQLKQVIYHALPIAYDNKFSSNKLKYILNA